MPDKPSSKRQFMEEHLDHGAVQLVLDARREGVSVPHGFAARGLLRLNFSPRFEPGDLVVDDWGAKQTLSFAGHSYAVRVPWSAVYAEVFFPGHGSQAKGDAFWWAESAPEDFASWVASERGESKAAPDESYRPPGKRGHLRIVK